MYERFTDNARAVMQLANQNALRLHQTHIGTEHVLLGIAEHAAGVAVGVLRSMGVDIAEIPLRVHAHVQQGSDVVTAGKLPMTLGTKTVIEFAMQEALDLGHHYVGTAHLLLGMLHADGQVAAHVLAELGVDLENLRAKVLEFLDCPEYRARNEAFARPVDGGRASCSKRQSFLSFRFSLRYLLGAIAFFAVACVALKSAGNVWWFVLSGVSMLLFMGVAVVAFTGRNRQRARAIGFTVCVVIYGTLLFLSRADELDPYQGRLPTTKLLLPLHQSMVTEKYVDIITGSELPDAMPAAGRGGMPTAVHLESPDRSQFMAIGHLLWAILLGVAGAIFAGLVDACNERRPTRTPT